MSLSCEDIDGPRPKLQGDPWDQHALSLCLARVLESEPIPDRVGELVAIAKKECAPVIAQDRKEEAAGEAAAARFAKEAEEIQSEQWSEEEEQERVQQEEIREAREEQEKRHAKLAAKRRAGAQARHEAERKKIQEKTRRQKQPLADILRRQALNTPLPALYPPYGVYFLVRAQLPTRHRGGLRACEGQFRPQRIATDELALSGVHRHDGDGLLADISTLPGQHCKCAATAVAHHP